MRRIWDAGGVALSSLCLVHCLGLPFLAVLLPLAGTLAEDERVHAAVIGLAAPVAWFAFAVPYLQRRVSWPLPVLATLALGLLAAGLIAPEEHELALTVGGGVLLAFAHVVNLRARPHEH
jgi:hypothetical protein